MQRVEALRVELGIEDPQAWYPQVLAFMQEHQFYTPTAQALRDHKKEINMRHIEGLILPEGVEAFCVGQYS
jgi:hypothetical protein